MSWLQQGNCSKSFARQLQQRSRASKYVTLLPHACFVRTTSVVRVTTMLLMCLSLHCQFAIKIKIRHSDKLQRMKVIDAVAALFEAPHSVDLTNPDAIVVIECVRSVCGLSILLTDQLHSKNFSIKFAPPASVASATTTTTPTTTTAKPSEDQK